MNRTLSPVAPSLLFALCMMLVADCSGADVRKPSAPAAKPTTAEPKTTAPAALPSPDSAASAPPAPAKFTVLLITSKGEVEIAVDRSLAPHGADRLHYLASHGFFTGARFYRVMRGFAAQFGLSGVPAVDQAFEAHTIKDDQRKISNTRGTLVFASHGPNTRSTQLFINTADNGRRLDAQGFAPVGRVMRGMDVVDALESVYGESSNMQGRIMTRGNEFLRVRFPDLDSIVRAEVKK